MERFSEVQEGDRVWCDALGEGRSLCGIDEEGHFKVMFDFGGKYHITDDGSFLVGRGIPCVFYDGGDEGRYLTKRPKAKVDWNAVPVGAECQPGGVPGTPIYFAGVLKNKPWFYYKETGEELLYHFPNARLK